MSARSLDAQFAAIDASCGKLLACFDDFRSQVERHVLAGELKTARYIAVDEGHWVEVFLGPRGLRLCGNIKNAPAGLQGFLVCYEWKFGRSAGTEWVQVLS